MTQMDKPNWGEWEDAPEKLPRAGESEAISIRLPKIMLTVIKEFAKREDIGYQVLIKRWLDEKTLEERDAYLTRIGRRKPMPTTMPMPKTDRDHSDGAGHYEFKEIKDEQSL